MNFRSSLFDHPNRVCMTYLEHMRFSLGIAFRLFQGALAATLHAFVPNLCIQSTTHLVHRLQQKLDAAGCRENA